ncbi:MAG TPA: T9SS type A sorting domain-containing protein, partial [Gelidibacter sp.]|uniref:T9SS type A sorting domain-containing protein n=1 Tax=Gelidibacter sp. TaxID=2018083 RepID=UPI002BFC7529
GAGVEIASTGSIKVHGHLITSDNFLVKSTSSRFGSLIVVKYEDEDDDQIPTVSAQVTGKVKYSRFVNDRGDNDLISAPVSGQGFMEFWQTNPNLARNNAGTRFIFGPFDKATGDYVISTDSDNYILEPGIGYRAASEGRDPLVFNGTVSVGNVSVTIEESGTGYKEWNLIGNPYPTFISLQALGGPNQNLLHAEAQGIYAYTPGNSSNKWRPILFGAHAGAAIAPGQGFYVAALPTAGSFLFRPSMMMDGSESDDFIAGRTENKDANSGFLKLNISNEGKNYDTELFFMEQASRGLDPGYDGRVYGKKAGAFAIYSHLVEDSKGTDMAVQSVGYSDLTNGVVIPIGINASEGMQITVNISEFNLPEGTEVRLEDNSNNTFTLLNTSDYTFTATSNLKDIGRFFLHVSTKPLSNKDDILNGLQIYTTNKSKTLYVKGLIKDQAQVNIYDIQGRIMTSASLKANTNSNEVDMSNLSTGIYVAELKSSGSVKTQKVILK